MNHLSPQLDRIGCDLDAALARLFARRARRRRRLRVAAIAAAAALGLSAAALASGIGPDLQLDPAKWSILGGGSVDEGRGEYVHAQSREDGGHSTFMVEHDGGLDRYQAFLLHERVKETANASSPVPVLREPGALCTRAELAEAEQVALDTLRARFAAGASPNATKPAVTDALDQAFRGRECRGLEYGGEIARLVFAGLEPEAHLMPGVR